MTYDTKYEGERTMVKTSLEVIRSLERKKWGEKEGAKEGRTITDQ